MFQSILSTKNLDALLISNKENIGYLSGFWGSFGYLIISKKGEKLFTDGRYLEEAKKSVFPKIEVQDYQALKKYLKNKKMGFEADFTTISQFKNWKKNFPATKFYPTQKIIENLRISKTEDEIKKIKKGAQINDKILAEIQKIIRIDITEKELEWEIRKLAFTYGAEKMAFRSIVNFGKQTAHPHHEPNQTKLKKGDLILVDLGVKLAKYCSDITRVFFTKPPTKKQADVFQIVLEAQKKALEMIEKTNDCQKIDQSARAFITEKGYGNYFTHSLGHGVGLEIHESPSLSSLTKSKLQENSIFTIEPGIYLPDEFGIRLEDLFVYKQKKALPLSQFTKEIQDLFIPTL